MQYRVVGVPLIIAAFCGGLRAQPAPRFNVDTTLVLIPANVTDPTNRFVLGLQKQDFHLFEDGVEQTIAHFSGEDTPLSVGLVFDASGSMDDKLETSRQAALQFLKTMNPQDEAFLVQFSDKADLVAGFTDHIDEVQRKLSAVKPGGLTALLDGVQIALGEMKKAKNPRKAILVISDGGDNHSRYTSSQIQALVREADVQIYAMGVFEPLIFLGMTKEEISGPRLLTEIAEQTGGRVFAATDSHDLPSVAARIGIELRNQYVLAYSPKNQQKDGKYRKVEVKVTQLPGLSSLKVRWRLGYYAPSD
ncbi:MAG TPA: VWA domain-containing protein [Bryobacteraceae bacterium]|nr:VWA domain-containing protein [Bryobacteraceae bacterium]